jgi:hypothetical protein
MKSLLLYSQILFSLFLFSCKKQQIGPSLSDVAGPVTFVTNLSASNTNPDFSTNGSIFFNAAFQNDASWVLTLTGNISGAVKKFKGVGKIIDASNSFWNGSSETPISFSAEPVIVRLTFPSASAPTPQQITINIIGIKNLNAQGVIVSDFSTKHSGWTSDWPYSEPYNGVGNIPIYNGSFILPALSLPDGNNILFMAGKPWQGIPVSPYVDFLTIKDTTADVNYGKYFPLYPDPTQVYLNFELYNTYNPAMPIDSVNNPYAWVQFNVLEEGGITRTFEIKNPDWTGWKLFSIRYDKFISTNTIFPQPNRVKQVQIVLLSTFNPTDQVGLKKNFVSIGIDHLIFTNGKPYKP